MRKLLKSPDVFVLLTLFFVLLAANLHRLSEPAFWDETKVYLHPLRLFHADVLDYFFVPITRVHRPPGLHFLYLPFLKAFSFSLPLIRALNFLYFFLGSALFYLSTKKESRLSGVVTLLFYLPTPIVFVYSMHYVAEPQMFFLFSLTLFLLTRLRPRHLALFLVGFLAGLTRENALALTPAILFFFWRRDHSLSLRDVLCALAPVFALLTHLLIDVSQSGQWFHHAVVVENHYGVRHLFADGFEILRKNFLVPYRLSPLLILFLVLGSLKIKTIKPSPTDGFGLMLALSFALAYCFLDKGSVIPRYYFAAVPFLVYPLAHFLLSRKTRLATSFLIAVILLPPQLIGEPRSNRETLFTTNLGLWDTLQYPEVIQLHQRVVAEVKMNSGVGDEVVAIWPYAYLLQSDGVGYGASTKAHVLETFPPSDVPPKVIIWNPYYEEILPEAELKRITSRAIYEKKVFRLGHMYADVYFRTRD